MSDQIPAFVSYAAAESRYGHEVKSLLKKHGIDGFLAHEDLLVSEQWRLRILEELGRCEVFIPLISKAFKASDWCAQEAGIAIARADAAIVPLTLDGTPPYGFLAQYQARRFPESGITEELLITPIIRQHPRKLLPGMIARVEQAGGWRIAEAALAPLVPFFNNLDQSELDRLVEAAVGNSEVWSASKCVSQYLPALLKLRRAHIKPDRLAALEHQLAHQEWYQP